MRINGNGDHATNDKSEKLTLKCDEKNEDDRVGASNSIFFLFAKKMIRLFTDNPFINFVITKCMAFFMCILLTTSTKYLGSSDSIAFSGQYSVFFFIIRRSVYLF